MPDSVTLFRDAGAALYGPRWQRDLGAALGVSTRSVRAWAAGERDIPEGVWGDLRDALILQLGDIANLLRHWERCRAGTPHER
jgi:hypothetical protein